MTSTTIKTLMLVKSTNVSLCVKTIGELLTVQNTVKLIVLVHSKSLNVMVLGTVTKLKMSLLKLLLTMIPTLMVLLTQKITSKLNITMS